MDDDRINRRTDALELLNIEAEHTDEYPDVEPWGEMLAQEIEDFEQAFGFYGCEEDW